MNGALDVRAAGLRAAFDGRFADATRSAPGRQEDFLLVAAGGGWHAIRMAEMSGLVTDHPVTPLPVAVPELLGLAGFRGAVVAVYDLAGLLGHGAAENPRWMLLTPAPTVVALAFDGVLGHLRVPVPAEARAVVHARDRVWPVLSIPTLLTSIAALGRTRLQKER